MRPFISLALAVLAPSPLQPNVSAQTPNAVAVSAPQIDPLQVKPVAPTAKPSQETPEAAAIHAKLESFGYGDISGLDRDSEGLWHAHATKGNAAVGVVVDKGGRILPQPQH